MAHAGIFSYEYRQDTVLEPDRIGMNTMKSLMKTSVIPLVHAVLCLDCNCVTDANQVCPVCSSRALMNLASVLNRRSTFSHSLKQVAA